MKSCYEHRVSRALPFAVTLLLAACSGGGSSSANSSMSSMLTLAATSSTSAAAAIPVGGGTLTLDTAVFHVDHVHITQELAAGVEPGSSNPSGGSTDHGHGHRHHIVHGDPQGGGGPGAHQDEIEVVGPFTFDVVSGTTVLDSVSVYPGTFTGSELFFSLEVTDPFADHSMVFTGAYQPTVGGDPIPVTLRSAWLERMTVPIANGGVVVTENSVIPIEIAFDLETMLGTLDLSTATIENDEILIDETHNPTLLDAFENGLGHHGGCAEFREHGQH